LYYEYKPGDVVRAPAPIYHKLTDAPVKYSKITNVLPSGDVDIHFIVNGSHPPGLKIKTRADTKVESTEMFAVEIYYDSHKFGKQLAGRHIVQIKDKTNPNDYKFTVNTSKNVINEGDTFDLTIRADGYIKDLDDLILNVGAVNNGNNGDWTNDFEIISQSSKGDNSYSERTYTLKATLDEFSEANEEWEFGIKDTNGNIQSPVTVKVNEVSHSLQGTKLQEWNGYNNKFEKSWYKNGNLIDLSKYEIDRSWTYNGVHNVYGRLFSDKDGGDAVYWRKPNTNDINISLKYTSSQPKLIKKKNDDIGKLNVTGSFQEGGKLSANVEDIDGLNSQNISYQWFYGSSHTTKENGELKTTWKNIDFIDGAVNKNFIIPGDYKSRLANNSLGVEINYHDDEGFFTHKRLLAGDSWKIKSANVGSGKVTNNWSANLEKISRNGFIEDLKVSLKNIDILNDPDGDLLNKTAKKFSYNWYLNDKKLATTNNAEYNVKLYEDISVSRWHKEKRSINGDLKLQIGYKDAQGFDNLTDKIKITDVRGVDYVNYNIYSLNWQKTGSGHSNTTPNINFKFLSSDKNITENSNIKFDFDISELKDPEGYQKDSLKYRFNFGAFNDDWKTLDQSYEFNLRKHRWFFDTDRHDKNWIGRYGYNRQPQIDWDGRYGKGNIELSYIDGKGNVENIKSSNLFQISQSENYDLDTKYNGNFKNHLRLEKRSTEYKLKIGGIENDLDGLSNIQYLSYKWYRDNKLVQETKTNNLTIDKNNYFGDWKVEVEYKDDNLFRNIVSPSLNIKDSNKVDIKNNLILIKKETDNNPLDLKAIFNFDQETKGLNNDSIYYQWYLNNNQISVTTENQLTPSSSGAYKVILNYKDNLGFDKKFESSSLNYNVNEKNKIQIQDAYLTNSYSAEKNIIRKGYKLYAPIVSD
ncbi:MAG: hypothetical protein VYB19_04985, partial [Bacteroidota bacterium]|nr:hypothetical protein [Bacteroidota bacterium]